MNLRLSTLKKSGFRWWFRVQMHYAIGGFLTAFAKFMVHRFVASKDICQLQELPVHLRDRYPYCKEKTKQFCPTGDKPKYRLYIKGQGYCFFGRDPLECYMTCLYRFYSANGSLVFPKYPRYTKKSLED